MNVTHIVVYMVLSEQLPWDCPTCHKCMGCAECDECVDGKEQVCKVCAGIYHCGVWCDDCEQEVCVYCRDFSEPNYNRCNGCTKIYENEMTMAREARDAEITQLVEKSTVADVDLLKRYIRKRAFHDILLEYVLHENYYDGVVDIIERATELINALHDRGLTLRDDSMICQYYVLDANEDCLEDVVDCVEEMAFYYDKTAYPSIYAQYCAEYVEDDADDDGHVNLATMDRDERNEFFEERAYRNEERREQRLEYMHSASARAKASALTSWFTEHAKDVPAENMSVKRALEIIKSKECLKTL